MSTTLITRRAIPVAGAAVALTAALALGSLSWAHDGSGTTDPSTPSHAQQVPPASGPHHLQPTTSGGKVMVGQ